MKDIICIVAGALVATAAGASPLCTDVAGQSISGMSCTAGGLTFTNFQVVAAAGNPSPEINLSESHIGADGSVTLTFDPHMSAVPGGGAQDVYLYYQVTGGATQLSLSLSGTNATVTEIACGAPIARQGLMTNLCPDGQPLASLIAFGSGGLNVASSNAFSAAENLYIFKDVGVFPNYPTSGTGTMNSFSQTFSLPESGGGGGAGGEVPEPATLLLMGSALVTLGIFRRGPRIT